MLGNFFDAVISNNENEIGKFLQCGVNPNVIIDRHKLTPLHFAVLHDSIKATKLLLVAGADLDAEDIEGWTPLDWAMSGGHYAMIDLLDEFKRKH